MHDESIYDVHEEWPDYDCRGDELHHSPPDEPNRAGAVAWLIVGYVLIPVVLVFGAVLYSLLCRMFGGGMR